MVWKLGRTTKTMGKVSRKMGNAVRNLGKTVEKMGAVSGKMGKRPEKMGRAFGELGNGVGKMGTSRPQLGNGRGKLGEPAQSTGLPRISPPKAFGATCRFRRNDRVMLETDASICDSLPMSASEATAEVFFTAFKSLKPRQRELVLERMLDLEAHRKQPRRSRQWSKGFSHPRFTRDELAASRQLVNEFDAKEWQW